MTDFSRYHRQMRYPPIGESGQRKLQQGRVLVVGCGALGSVIASTLARSGVGYLRLIDRDFLELSNLQRQVLYDERDVADQLPKAVAAERKLRQINSEIRYEAIVADLDHTNIESLLRDIHVVLDGTDNFETRFLINDAALKYSVPWIYGGCLGDDGQTMTIVPRHTPCLRCLHPEPPPPGSVPTCDSAGILAPIVSIIASLQANEALKILSGNQDAISRTLTICELWDNRLRQIKLDALDRQQTECPACTGREFPWLDGRRGSHTAALCGRNAVQLTFPQRGTLSLEHLEEKLKDVGSVSRNRYLLRLKLDDHVVTVFPDGRAIINGTEDIAEARSIYARYIGN